MKILVLVHEDLIPADSVPSLTHLRKQPWKTEFDVVQSLKRLGHEVKILGVKDDLKIFRETIDNFRPNIVFNLLEEFAGEAVYDQNVVSYLELLSVKYTGSSPRGLILARDKALAKKILKFHSVNTANFWVFNLGKKVQVPTNITYPLIVKTLNEEASLGIAQSSVVKNKDELKKRIEYLFEYFETDVIAEEYIEGREFYVGVLGNDRTKTLPIIELDLKNLPKSTHKIATTKIKWDLDYRKKFGIKNITPEDLDEKTQKKILTLCKRAYKALDLTGYARIDLRMNSNGDVYFLEANPNPDIGAEEEFAHAAKLQGLEYDELLSNILNLGIRR